MQTALRGAEHRAAKAKTACESAYSRLCLAIDSAARQAAAPPPDPQHQVQTSGGSGGSTGRGFLGPKPDPSPPADQPQGRPSRCGPPLRNGKRKPSSQTPPARTPPAKSFQPKLVGLGLLEPK